MRVTSGQGLTWLGDAVGLALVHDVSEEEWKETTRHFLHLLKHVGHLQEVSLRAIQLYVPRRRVA